MRECVDEGVLQAYFDGELPPEKARSVASHLASCLTCTQAARELEREALLLSEALEAEFTAPVPTERLRHKVDAAIAGLHVVSPVRPLAGASSSGWFASLFEMFKLSPQRGFAYAGMAAVALLVATLGWMQFPSAPSAQIAGNGGFGISGRTAGPLDAVEPVREPPSKQVKQGFVAVKKSPTFDIGAKQSPIHLLPGEKSYLTQIARLDSTIKAESGPMKPTFKAEYERNLQLVDRAIAATRSAAKSNPNDREAVEFRFAAYQSKVYLLNQVADARLSNRPKP